MELDKHAKDSQSARLDSKSRGFFLVYFECAMGGRIHPGMERLATIAIALVFQQAAYIMTTQMEGNSTGNRHGRRSITVRSGHH